MPFSRFSCAIPVTLDRHDGVRDCLSDEHRNLWRVPVAGEGHPVLAPLQTSDYAAIVSFMVSLSPNSVAPPLRIAALMQRAAGPNCLIERAGPV